MDTPLKKDYSQIQINTPTSRVISIPLTVISPNPNTVVSDISVQVHDVDISNSKLHMITVLLNYIKYYSKQHTRSCLLYATWISFIISYNLYIYVMDYPSCRTTCQLIGINEPINTFTNIAILISSNLVVNKLAKRIFAILGFASTLHHMYYNCSLYQGRADVGSLIYLLLRSPEILYNYTINHIFVVFVSVFWVEWQEQFNLQWNDMYAIFGIYIVGLMISYLLAIYHKKVQTTLSILQVMILGFFIMVTLTLSTIEAITHNSSCIYGEITHSLAGHIVLPLSLAVVSNNNIITY